jgi:alpha-glucuronidase
VYLSANFAAPQRIGGLGTADPVDESVISWWGKKCDEVYSYIPDFGGFLVKANSEGQPGPKTYNRTHAQGANCLANAIVHHGGIVIWRAFVYDDAIDSDRAKRAFKEFKSLDGKFHENVIVQVKNGPFDFQPREPVHPLFGGLTSTHVGGEFQITKEYLGQDVHLVYLAPYWKEVLDFDTYAKGKGSTVGKVLDGSVYNDTISCIAGVANTGSDINWCDHHFDQANWYAFGRLAWNYTLQSEEIADEWIKMTWSWKPTAVTTITKMMMGSHEACVNYMDPLGLCGLFMHESHYGPEPDYNSDLSHPDWNSLYWHKADNAGLGYDRTTGNSTYVNTYFPENVSKFKNISSCPPEYLCWFFHVPWDHTMTNGKLFWDELCYRYNDGLHYVGVMDSLQWPSLNAFIDVQRFSDVKGKLDDHYSNAKKWRDVCVNYFGKFSKMPIPPYKPITKINKQKRVLTGNYNPILVYDLQGKLLTTIIQENGITNIVNKNNIVRSLPSGMYILYQDGVKPSKLLVGARSLLFKGIYR